MKERPVSPVNGQPLPRGKPFTTGDERAKQAGKRSAEKRWQRKTMREELLVLLEQRYTTPDGRKTGTQEEISLALIQQATKGNTKAYEIIRDTIGEKPAENVNIVTADFGALESAFKGLGE